MRARNGEKAGEERGECGRGMGRRLARCGEIAARYTSPLGMQAITYEFGDITPTSCLPDHNALSDNPTKEKSYVERMLS